MTDPLHKMAGDIGRIAGTLEAMEKRMDRDEASRSKIYARFEKVEEDISIVGAVAAQAREVAVAAVKTLNEDVVPQTSKIKNLGAKGGGFLAGAALVGGLASAPLWTQIAAAFDKMVK